MIPIIFAQSIMILPATIASFFPHEQLDGQALAQLLRAARRWSTASCTALIIIFFTYFYTAIVLNPIDLAENMRKYGGFIPGIRPGQARRPSTSTGC